DGVGRGMWERVDGSAPPVAGRSLANPMGAILSAALMLDYLGWRQEAAAIEAAVHDAIVNGQGTQDIGGELGTAETGDCIASHVQENARARAQSARQEPVTTPDLPSVTQDPPAAPAPTISPDQPGSEGSGHAEMPRVHGADSSHEATRDTKIDEG